MIATGTPAAAFENHAIGLSSGFRDIVWHESCGAATAVGSYVQPQHMPTLFVAEDRYLRSIMSLNEQPSYITRAMLVFLKMTGALNIGTSFSSTNHLSAIVYLVLQASLLPLTRLQSTIVLVHPPRPRPCLHP